MPFYTIPKSPDSSSYLAHAGKKGMKWGYNDGKKNGNRTAEEVLTKAYNLDELFYLANRDREYAKASIALEEAAIPLRNIDAYFLEKYGEDWANKLTESDKNAIASIRRKFTEAQKREDAAYWDEVYRQHDVTKYFKKHPEVKRALLAYLGYDTDRQISRGMPIYGEVVKALGDEDMDIVKAVQTQFAKSADERRNTKR